ncbi:MAG: hypothetical protein J2P34_12850 [Actinobacteria bacterium]|nr:hypothetical protein [Actinomycetota bacterium]
MEGIDSARQATARRREELDRRLQELHQRNHELATMLMGRRTDHGPGSSPEDVRRAEELARLASHRAIEAGERAGAMYLHSAQAHERAARMHAMLADTGSADAGRHRERAEEHLRLAAQDRASASELTSRTHDEERHGTG